MSRTSYKTQADFTKDMVSGEHAIAKEHSHLPELKSNTVKSNIKNSGLNKNLGTEQKQNLDACSANGLQALDRKGEVVNEKARETAKEKAIETRNSMLEAKHKAEQISEEVANKEYSDQKEANKAMEDIAQLKGIAEDAKDGATILAFVEHRLDLIESRNPKDTETREDIKALRYALRRMSGDNNISKETKKEFGGFNDGYVNVANPAILDGVQDGL